MRKDNIDRNIAVITTKFVLDKESPILCVFHYEDDGMWKFFGNEEVIDDNDYKVVSFQEMIEIDSSILDIVDLPLDYMASRESTASPWTIKPIN